MTGPTNDEVDDLVWSLVTGVFPVPGRRAFIFSDQHQHANADHEALKR